MSNPVRKLVIASAAFHKWGKSIGWQAALAWTAYQAETAAGLHPSSIKMRPRQIQHPVITRLGDSSDIRVFRQIFQFDEYACLRDIASPRLILDLGANVGYASAYFLSCFPTADVVAVEPDPGNFEQCRKNLVPYGSRAKVLHGAVWSHPSKLVLSPDSFRDRREWSVQVRESTDPEDKADVTAWDIPSLLEMSGHDSIDLLKIDIERSELELFGHNSSAWLPKVRNICIELHGEDCTDTYLNALQDFECDFQNSGELTISRNLHPRTRPNSNQHPAPNSLVH